MKKLCNPIKVIHPEVIGTSLMFPAISIDPNIGNNVGNEEHDWEKNYTQESEYSAIREQTDQDIRHRIYHITSDKGQPWSFYLHSFSPLQSNTHPLIRKYTEQGYTRLPDKAVIHFLANITRAELPNNITDFFENLAENKKK